MIKFKFCLALLLGVALHSPAAFAAGDTDQEQALRQTMQEAVWPADIAKAAKLYEAAYPQGAWVDAAHSLRQKAEASMLMLVRSDIMIFHSTVLQLSADKASSSLARQALLGDSESARQLARQVAQTAPGRYVGWLQWATALGNDKAAYELAVYYRAEGQPHFASRYEAKAMALGYVPLPALDHIRR
jgi:FlaA1/EpsC-like NDP-sugar epimerase